MIPHRKLVTAAFVVAGLYYGFTIVRDFDSILAANRTFFDSGPAWQANVLTAIIAMAPLGFFAVGLVVFQGAKWWVAAIPALIAIAFTIGISSLVLGAYLVLYYSVLVQTGNEKGMGV